MIGPVVGIDLRQFFAHPYASGIQRVLLGLLENWPSDAFDCRVLGTHEGRLFYISSAAAARCIRACFDSSGEFTGANDRLRQVVSRQLSTESRVETNWPEALLLVDRWLAPEPSTNGELLRNWREASRVMPTTFIFYDALPQTNPEFYELTDTYGWSPYFRMMASSHRVVSISEHVADVLAGRLRNTHACARVVAPPGADHIDVKSSRAPRRTSFLAISSVEKRKRLSVLIEAFAAASAEVSGMELHIVGRRSSDDTVVQAAIEQNEDLNITWSRDVNDEALAAITSKTTALFSIGEEGYGLPVLEMLRRGCPVVFAGTQPAAELAAGIGAMKLADHSIDTVKQAMLLLAHPEEATKLRLSIGVDRLPTWKAFAASVAKTAAAPRCVCDAR